MSHIENESFAALQAQNASLRRMIRAVWDLVAERSISNAECVSIDNLCFALRGEEGECPE